MRNYKCLVVDDELLIIRRLEQMFANWQWTHPQFKLSGTALSAREGISHAYAYKPDIVITDIVMPGKNGIDMVSELQDQLPNTQFIILSAYTDFQYAKQAVSMNVLDYLVKVPLREQELLNALLKAQTKLEHMGKVSRELQQLNMGVRENMYRLRKQVMEEICYGKSSPELLEQMHNVLMIEQISGHYTVLMLKIDRYDQFTSMNNSHQQKLLRFGILNITEEIIQEEEGAGAGFACEFGEARHVAVLYWRSTNSRHQISVRSKEIGQRIASSVAQYLKISVSIGIGPYSEYAEQLPSSCLTAGRTLDETFYMRPSTVILESHEQDEPEDEEGLRRLRVWQEQIDGAFTRTEVETLRHQIPLFGTIIREVKPRVSALVPMMNDWLLQLEHSLNAREMNQADGSQGSAEFRYEDTDADFMISDVQNRLGAILEIARQSARERPEIVAAKAYIEQHLQQTIYLEQVASHVNMNATYFSEVFKRELQEGFTDYVNRRRIERAALILHMRSCSNLELSDEVGIHNERYFCTLFKKYKGVSPQKYRRNHVAL
jgi:two-component system response regulator YesN